MYSLDELVNQTYGTCLSKFVSLMFSSTKLQAEVVESMLKVKGCIRLDSILPVHVLNVLMLVCEVWGRNFSRVSILHTLSNTNKQSLSEHQEK